ncbi:PREDICTED: tubulointerstitial nephritis antigen-like isoform X1 [Myotis brandtii]|uniref:tubulointerstitial nephritis antigen-like isoform X1 n=1 Tax=Myotis brandtii TaxID=109478 RepID=UPI000703F01E|nr:PREDICTED: tubulointerstitial nephritis antigen-like isoform X1 [Myotis brandtii]
MWRCPQRLLLLLLLACALPYLGATCYCDLFCNRTISDCCPDFWDFCLGVPPPFPPSQGCMHGGRIYPILGTYQDNCNRCTCQEKGQWECDQEPCLVDQDMINAINQGNYGWRAGNHSAFWGMTLDEGIRYRLGTIRPSPSVTSMNEIHTMLVPGEVLPTAFEASEKWPNLIHEPLDQGNCAGSWAFSTAAVASDRVSIHSLGHMTPVLSPQNLLSCDKHNQQGCRGGHLDGAWWFLRRRGVVSDHCYPFSGREKTEAGPAPRCMMHTRATGRGKRQATARCPNHHAHANDIYQVTPAYRLGSSETEIMKELMENGPVQALMEVHEDFFLYQGGIYSHTPVSLGRPERYRRHGTHSVKITGPQPTRGAQPGARRATSASCVEPTSVTSRASCWGSGAVWAWRTWVTTEAVATMPGQPAEEPPVGWCPCPTRLPGRWCSGHRPTPGA